MRFSGDGPIICQTHRPELFQPAAQPRALGRVEIGVKHRGPRSALATLHQSGAFKALFPRQRGAALEAILINTAGGITGGDRFSAALEVGANAHLAVTTQAAERAYRAQPGRCLRRPNLVCGWLFYVSVWLCARGGRCARGGGHGELRSVCVCARALHTNTAHAAHNQPNAQPTASCMISSRTMLPATRSATHGKHMPMVRWSHPAARGACARGSA